MIREPDLLPEHPEKGGNVEVPTWVIWTVLFLATVVSFPFGVYVTTTLRDIREDLREAKSDRWKRADMREWAHELRDDNWELRMKVPDVDVISSRLDGRIP